MVFYIAVVPKIIKITSEDLPKTWVKFLYIPSKTCE